MGFLEFTYYFSLGVIVTILLIFSIRFGIQLFFNIMKRKLNKLVTR